MDFENLYQAADEAVAHLEDMKERMSDNYGVVTSCESRIGTILMYQKSVGKGREAALTPLRNLLKSEQEEGYLAGLKFSVEI